MPGVALPSETGTVRAQSPPRVRVGEPRAHSGAEPGLGAAAPPPPALRLLPKPPLSPLGWVWRGSEPCRALSDGHLVRGQENQSLAGRGKLLLWIPKSRGKRGKPHCESGVGLGWWEGRKGTELSGRSEFLLFSVLLKSGTSPALLCCPSPARWHSPSRGPAPVSLGN